VDVGGWRAVVSSKVSAYPLVAFAVSAGAAAGASAIQLASEYPRWPLADLRFGWRWSAIAGLDAVAGIAALAIVHALGWSKDATWLTSILGWVVVGVIATMVVRADLLELPVGQLSVPVGFGAVYGTIRSLVEPGLKDRHWSLSNKERRGRRIWSLNTADTKYQSGSLKFDEMVTVMQDYVLEGASYKDDNQKNDAIRDANKAIEDARKNLSADGSSAGPEAVKQLITYMLEEDYVSILDDLLGTPPKNLIRTWRRS
jgi:hypothetical protein